MKMGFLENGPRPECFGLRSRDAYRLLPWALDGLFLGFLCCASGLLWTCFVIYGLLGLLGFCGLILGHLIGL
jgi:hypothetical protein